MLFEPFKSQKYYNNNNIWVFEMDDTNLAPWIRVINEGNLVVFQGKLCSVCHVEEIPLNEGNSVEIPLKERGGRWI